MASSEFTELEQLAKKTFNALRSSGLSLATAESCTGGWIGKLITDHSGASKHYVGGVICYSNKAKRKLLGVKLGDKAEAVTSRVAVEMAEGALKKLGADIAVSTTGYMEKSANKSKKLEAYICVAMRQSKICEHFFFDASNRGKNRITTSHHALRMLLEIITSKEN